MSNKVEEARDALLNEQIKIPNMDVSQAIQYLGSQGYSKIELISAVRDVFLLGFSEAKEAVHLNPVFAYRRECDEATQAGGIEGFEKLARLHEPLSVDSLLEIWEWEPVPGCPGRVSLIGKATEIRADEIVNDQFPVLEFRPAQDSAPRFLVILPDGGMISTVQSDGSFVHELSGLEDFDRATVGLDLPKREIRRMQVAAYAQAMAGTDQDLDPAWEEAGLESLRKMYDEEEA